VPFISLIKFINGTRNEVWRDYLPIFDSFNRDHPESYMETAGIATG